MERSVLHGFLFEMAYQTCKLIRYNSATNSHKWIRMKMESYIKELSYKIIVLAMKDLFDLCN